LVKKFKIQKNAKFGGKWTVEKQLISQTQTNILLSTAKNYYVFFLRGLEKNSLIKS